MTIEQLKKDIEDRGHSSYYDHDFAQELENLFDIRVIDTQRIVRQETKENLDNHTFTGKNKEGKAQKAACFSILSWLTDAKEYQVNTNDLRDLANFVESHRKACVWAVLIGKSLKGKE